MTSKDKDEGAIDITEVGLVAAGAALGGAAGAGLGVLATLLAKAPKALQRGVMARQVRFIERIAYYLEEQDPAGAAEFIASHSETSEFADTLERGYEAMRRGLDPTAEECICLLTADHARQGRPTDRRFVRAAALLEACDLSMLRTLNAITTSYTSVSTTGDYRLLFHRGAARRKARGLVIPASFFIIAYSSDGQDVGISEHTLAPKNLRRALVDLAHHDYGEAFVHKAAKAPVTMPLPGPSVCRHVFPRTYDDAMHALHRYLAPVRRMAPATARDDEQAAILEEAVRDDIEQRLPKLTERQRRPAKQKLWVQE